MDKFLEDLCRLGKISENPRLDPRPEEEYAAGFIDLHCPRSGVSAFFGLLMRFGGVRSDLGSSLAELASDKLLLSLEGFFLLFPVDLVERPDRDLKPEGLELVLGFFVIR